MADVARKVVIRGRVQGVGFRHATVEAARAIAVAGWVRNRPDGAVEAFAQGAAADVERFVAWCRHGPPLARVDDVEVGQVPVEAGLARFDWK
ncbi:MAG: acylphosphatase [Betaproteobacteria bacterium]|nr:acylphosphatase [Betaproteobacteria bacterium]